MLIRKRQQIPWGTLCATTAIFLAKLTFALLLFHSVCSVCRRLNFLTMLRRRTTSAASTTTLPFCFYCNSYKTVLRKKLLPQIAAAASYSTNNGHQQKLEQSKPEFVVGGGRRTRSLSKYTPDKIRNFAIIAHIDHGKSTLSDRLLQMTNVIPADADAQYLDKLDVERERGITVKAQTCTMFYREHMLNLIDTPGHVDFSFEVKRSLVACDGAILLVAANQGVQAQTIFNFWTAFEADLTIIPVINKVDMPVDVAKVERQMQSLFDFKSDEVLRISAKNGLNVPQVLDAIVERIPAPKKMLDGNQLAADAACLAHVFDSWFDPYKGAILLVIVKQGVLRREMPIRFVHYPDKEYIVAEVGFLHPEMMPCEALNVGQVGFIHCGIKSTRDVVVGDTLFHSAIPVAEVQPFMEITRIKPSVYSGLFPVESGDYERLKQAVESLQLNDNSVELQPDSSAVFGQGWRVGFVGNLHLEVFGQRLEKEHGELAVFTNPSVEYLADIIDNESIRKRRYRGQSRIVISKPAAFPEFPTDVAGYLEPMSLVTIVTPAEHFHEIDALCREARGEPVETTYIDESRMLLKWRLPLGEVIVDFFDRLRRISSGYASFDQKDNGYRECKLEKVCVYINDKPIEELSMLCPTTVAQRRATQLIGKLKHEIPRQQFEVTVRASLGASRKAIAHAVLRPMKKDFAGVLKGNFVADRLGKKMKHQREGKERMKMVGNVQIPRAAFLNVMRK